MIDVALAIDAEAIDLTHYTRADGIYDSGGFLVKGAETTVTIRGSVQPTNARELKDMPEGIRSEAMHTVRTRVRISADDEIGYDGRRWRVLKVHEWKAYTKAWLGLKKP